MKIYEERRLKLTENLSGDIAVIIPGSVLANRSNDTAYPFRQDSNFYYLSGFTVSYTHLTLPTTIEV